MRLKKKYKIFGLSQKLNRSNSIGNPLIPTKILELNRTKWKRIKDLKKLSVNSLFIDPFSVQHSFDTWTRLNSHRTESYKAKNEIGRASLFRSRVDRRGPRLWDGTRSPLPRRTRARRR